MALADQAASALPFHQLEEGRPHAASRTPFARRILGVCAISGAMFVTGCARDSTERVSDDPTVHEAKTEPAPHEAKAPVVRVASRTRRSSEQHRNARAQIRRIDPALLTPQPAPDCEYTRSDLNTVDSDEWARLKAEYERQCYQDAEEAARERLGLLQASIQETRD
jgi:hypothetical protein